jgi:flagellar export protein FliJ
MKKFLFNLEGMLRQKQWLEDEAKRTLGIELQKHNDLKKILSKQQNEYEYLQVQRRVNGHLDSEGHLHYIRYSKKVVQDMGEQKKCISSQDDVIQKRTVLLHKAMTERKKLEKLREKQFEKYAVYKKRKEAKLADEIASNIIQSTTNSLK